MQRAPRLWVCWRLPQRLGAGEPILSFLSPAAEDRLARGIGAENAGQAQILSGRDAVQRVRADVRQRYLNLVAALGTARGRDGATLRQLLAGQDGVSRWWFHPVAFKDCEADPTYDRMLALFAIVAEARKQQCHALVLVGAPSELATVLKGAFAVSEQQSDAAASALSIWMRGLRSRVAYFVRFASQRPALVRHAPVPAGTIDIALSAFWDWSVSWDTATGSVSDRYFTSLPEALERLPAATPGWFAWFDPLTKRGADKRAVSDVVAPLANGARVVILQCLLQVRECLRAVTDYGPLATYLRARRWPSFHEIFRADGIDCYPLFSHRLLEGFSDVSLPHAHLVALAVERACRRYRPAVALTFLEHFPFSRAFYQGVRRASPSVTRVAVQHASYNHDKTFLFLQPALEFRGQPDGCAVPHADAICAMGTLGRDLFLECGYSQDDVVLTGSPRYEHMSLPRDGAPAAQQESRDLRVLLVPTLHVDVELALVEAACLARRGLSGLRLLLRNHPLVRIDRDPRFDDFRTEVEIREGSLEQDLEEADLVLFTYSTVAEEAFVQGTPVWQWAPKGFDGSALAEVTSIPRFTSVADLRAALLKFQNDPAAYVPDRTSRHRVFERLFHPEGSVVSHEIARVLKPLLRPVRSTSPNTLPGSVECSIA